MLTVCTIVHNAFRSNFLQITTRFLSYKNGVWIAPRCVCSNELRVCLHFPVLYKLTTKTLLKPDVSD